MSKKTYPSVRAEQDFDLVKSIVKDALSRDIHPDTEIFMHGKLAELKERVDSPHSWSFHLKENIVMAISLIAKGSVRRRVGATASVLCLAFLLLIALSQSGGGNLALAAVRDRADSIYSASWTFTVQTNGNPAKVNKRLFMEPGRLRQDWQSGIVSIIDLVAGKALTLVPDSKTYIIRNLEASATPESLNPIEYMRSLPDKADKSLGDNVINGRAVTGFRISEGDTWTDIWIDQETLGPVLHEFHNPKADLIQISSDFKINIAVEDSLLSLSPPEGYTLGED